MLSDEQCISRAGNLNLLHQYWKAGHFPHNHEFTDKPTPYFQDRHGVPSELAYLMAVSGRQDLVDRIVTINNNGTVPEIAGDPALGSAFRDWLSAAGFTLNE